ncbi:hypothetical protein EOA36_21315, partial [Mesorhizobium sp. M8A.F.Ca.ET.021.01.1.1]
MAFKSSLRFRTAYYLLVGAAPHPPAGTFSPYRDGEKEGASAPASIADALHPPLLVIGLARRVHLRPRRDLG